ncbi:MAG: HAMP domain-containing histidine kinase [Anaerolineales bacterium]|nr:HAMP domain-containing histidine kinase [Anaerolineales bacterium]
MKTESPNPLSALEARLADLKQASLPPDAAEILDEIIKLAAEAKHEKAAFVSTVAHELRTPMTSIMGYTDLLKGGMMGELNESQLGFLTVIRENVGRMSKLVADLSDIYKIESGRLKLEALPMPLASAVNAGLDLTADQIEARRQKVSVSLPNDLPMVFADPKRAAQMVNYLLENAVRYSPEGSPIEIRAESVGGTVRLLVTDHGIGIALADQPHIFTQFFRSEVEEVRAHKGWGLSLATTRALTELGGGSAGYESTPGAGSTFWVTFPAYTAD